MQHHQYDQMARSNVRMPRACKRTKQYTVPHQSLRQTRRSRVGNQEMLQQQNAMYTAAGVPEYVPCTMPESSAVSAFQETGNEARPPVTSFATGTQTEVQINDKELKFLRDLREEKINVCKLYSIIEKSDYIVTFEERSRSGTSAESMETEITNNSIAIVPFNAVQQRNDMMTLAYVAELQQRLAVTMLSANPLPAIEYNHVPQIGASSSPDPVLVQDSDSSQNEQQEDLARGSFLAEEQSTRNNNRGKTRPMQQQVPPVSFPIPNIMDQCIYNNHNNMNYGQRNRQGYFDRSSRPNPDSNNINLLQAAAFFGYVQQIHQQRSHEYNRPHNMFTQRPPWF